MEANLHVFRLLYISNRLVVKSQLKQGIYSKVRNVVRKEVCSIVLSQIFLNVVFDDKK